MSREFIKEIPTLIRDLYKIVGVLENNFPGRRFTLDGHLVGSIGEVLVAHYYNLTLLTSSQDTHDAISSDGRYVQIKATQINKIALRSEPSHLLVIQILSDGTFIEIYNGPGKNVWNNVGPKQSNGQSYITISKLKLLMNSVDKNIALPRSYVVLS